MATRAQLLQSVESLCNDFASKKDVKTLLSHFSTTFKCSAIEHGDPSLAPFLGRIFSGLEQVQEYFELLQKYLTYEEMVFSEYFADVESRKVSVKGRATFTWTETGESWEEHFVYTIDLDDEAQVTDYQVWADSGALYLASKGELRKVKESSSRPAPLK